MIRGTLRRKGYCSSWNYFIQLGLTDNSYTIQNSEFLTYREYINMFLPYDKELSVEEKFCIEFDISKKSEFLKIYMVRFVYR